MRTKLQQLLRSLDSALEPTERDAALADAKAQARSLLNEARSKADVVIQETRARYESESPAVKAKLADRLRKLADRLE